jgi:hypothetical protein
MNKISNTLFVIIIGIIATVSVITYLSFRIPHNFIRTPNIYDKNSQEILSKTYPKLIHYFPNIVSSGFVSKVTKTKEGYFIELDHRCHLMEGICYDGCFYVNFNKKYKIIRTSGCDIETKLFNDTLD